MITYTKRYYRVINWFKKHPVSKKDCQCENHHITPTSCGGSNDKENLVLLPTRWHYIVHCWLPLVYAEQGMELESKKMLYAWNRFQNYRRSFRESLQFLKEDSKLYQQLRNSYIELVRQVNSEINKGFNNSKYGCHWWKDPNDRTKSLSIKEGDPVPEGWVRGRWLLIKVKSRNKRVWYYNPITNESKQISFSEEENEKMINGGWIKGKRLFKKLKTYTSDGKNRLKIQENKEIPEGYMLLKEWRTLHPKPKKSFEEMRKQMRQLSKKSHEVKNQKRLEYIKSQLSIWKEMYLWYLNNGKDFEKAKEKFGYNRGGANFFRYIRIYFPEIYQFDTRKYKNPRPKKRGPYKKKQK